MNGPELDHVLRAVPPWRTGPMLTECGMLTDGKPVLTRDEFAAKVRTQGQRRSAMTTCMTCWQTAASHRGTWDTDPVAVMGREMVRARGWSPGAVRNDPAAVRVRDELLAIAELIGRHRDEFGTILDGLGETVQLGDLRGRRRSGRILT